MEFYRSESDKLKAIVAIGIAGVALSACTRSAEAIPGMAIVAAEPMHINTYEIVKPDAIELLPDAWEMAMHDTPGEVDIAVYDIATGKTAQWNTPVATTFNTASIVKYSILVKTLLQHQESGQPLSAYELSRASTMIENSDNGAASYLWRNNGGSGAMQEFFHSIDAEATTTTGSWGLTQTTATNQLEILKLLALPNSRLTPESITAMNSLLAHVEPYQHWGVSGGVPDGIPVWLKNGWLNDSATDNKYSATSSWTVNSIGNVGNKYLIAILSDGNPVGQNRAEQYGIDRIEKLSKITWDMFDAIA